MAFHIHFASLMLGAGLGYNKVFIMCASAALLGMAVYAGMYLWLRKTIPALARDAELEA